MFDIEKSIFIVVADEENIDVIKTLNPFVHTTTNIYEAPEIKLTSYIASSKRYERKFKYMPITSDEIAEIIERG